MRPRRRSTTDYETALREMAQIRTMITNLDRSICLLSCDIEIEEDRAGVRGLSDETYPMLARALATRRENLTLTRAALTERLEEIEAAKPAVVELAM
jgi:hypothetical protein